MIIHTVLYKFKHDLNKMANMAKAQSMLEGLKDQVKWVIDIEAGFDFNRGVSAYDLCFRATFQVKDHLLWFRAEPESIEVFNFINSCIEESHMVDYEINDYDDACAM